MVLEHKALTDGGILLGSGTGAITSMTRLGAGEILVGQASGDPQKLSIGSSAGQVLKVNSSTDGLEWGAGQADLSTSVGLGTSVGIGSTITIGNFNSNVGINLSFSSNNLHINGNKPTTSGHVIKYDGTNIIWDNPNEITYTVTVSSSKYYLNGVETSSISMQPGFTYIFDQSDSTNVVSGGNENQHHPLIFKTATTGGSEHTTDVTFYVNGVVANSGTYKTNFNNSTNRYVKIKVTNSTPTKLYYTCQNHSGMGGSSFNMISSVWGIGIGTFAAGDMIYASATNKLSKLTKGSAGQTLKMDTNGNYPEWGTVADVDVSSSTGIGTTATDKVIVCNTSEILQLNFSDLNINGTTPNTSGQYLGYNGSSVNWIGAKKVKGLALAGIDYNSFDFGANLVGTSANTFYGTTTKTIQFINYTPPTNWTQLEITIHFTIYNELINSDFTMELLIGSSTANNNIIIDGTEGGTDITYRYKQKYRNVSGNQCIEYTKTFLLQKDDVVLWTSNQYIKLQFTDNISTNTSATPYYLFR